MPFGRHKTIFTSLVDFNGDETFERFSTVVLYTVIMVYNQSIVLFGEIGRSKVS